MRRPLVVSVIGGYFLLAGTYLCFLATMILVGPRGLELERGMPYGNGLTLVSPYISILVGVVWIVAAWNLLRLRNWARWVIMLMLGTGSAFAAATMSITDTFFGWRTVFNWTEIAIRTATALYLASSSTIIGAFTSPRGNVSPEGNSAAGKPPL
jgi:uncharacterized membrane protein